MWEALIIVASLWAMTMTTLAIIARLKSLTSTRRSPTPPTPPTPTSESAIEAITKLAQASMEQMRDLAQTLSLGPPVSAPQSGPLETLPISSERPPNYDDDSIPLAPGIAAQMERESQEDEQHRLLTQRAALQARLAELNDAEAELSNGRHPSVSSLDEPFQ